MERKIKFRGKRSYDKEWIYGDLLQYENGDCAIFDRKISAFGSECTEMIKRDKVDKDTVCQFTGLQDINQKDIYEGDIMRSQYGRMYYIKYDENSCSFLAVQFGDDIAYPYILLKDWIHLFGKMVIGNIYDNKDLLKEGEVKNA